MYVEHRRLSDRAKALLTLLFAALACFYILSAGGCDFGRGEVVKETSEPHFLRGQEELRRGNISEALSAFLKVSEKRRDARIPPYTISKSIWSSNPIPSLLRW